LRKPQSAGLVRESGLLESPIIGYSAVAARWSIG
jgi:hypothetical protein